MILIIKHTDQPDDEVTCRSEIDNIGIQCNNLGIRLNISWTHRIFIAKRSQFIPNYKCLNDLCKTSITIKLLGVTFTDNLSWSVHIDICIKTKPFPDSFP